ncbi:hypothetical protein K488DRAFT_82605 [Vararia minispora EC-137]|uniref:Uncharacterized protein n=1 Tax=Vararia minispora EC-137 TaxID=1314806 RepID=A0ACB8QVM6_9AGAM|nr:hypothetical protein K488DRAFT_82605 [Vararia minispora EC-137]
MPGLLKRDKNEEAYRKNAKGKKVLKPVNFVKPEHLVPLNRVSVDKNAIQRPFVTPRNVAKAQTRYVNPCWNIDPDTGQISRPDIPQQPLSRPDEDDGFGDYWDRDVSSDEDPYYSSPFPNSVSEPRPLLAPDLPPAPPHWPPNHPYPYSKAILRKAYYDPASSSRTLVGANFGDDDDDEPFVTQSFAGRDASPATEKLKKPRKMALEGPLIMGLNKPLPALPLYEHERANPRPAEPFARAGDDRRKLTDNARRVQHKDARPTQARLVRPGLDGIERRRSDAAAFVEAAQAEKAMMGMAGVPAVEEGSIIDEAEALMSMRVRTARPAARERSPLSRSASASQTTMPPPRTRNPRAAVERAEKARSPTPTPHMQASRSHSRSPRPPHPSTTRLVRQLPPAPTQRPPSPPCAPPELPRSNTVPLRAHTPSHAKVPAHTSTHPPRQPVLADEYGRRVGPGQDPRLRQHVPSREKGDASQRQAYLMYRRQIEGNIARNREHNKGWKVKLGLEEKWYEG